MNTGVFRILGLAACLILAAAAIYVYRPNREHLAHITVVGDSTAKVAPDTAVLTFSVVTQGKEAVATQQENARRSEAVKTAVQSAIGEAKAEIKTSDYSLNPQQDNYSFKTPKILGYDVKNTVTVSVAKLDLVGNIIDAATKAGANSVDGIRFVIGEASPAQGDALALATNQAMAKAEAIARSLNGRIVRVVETREGGAPVLPAPDDDYRSNSAMSNTAEFKRVTTPVQAGSVNLRSQVVMVVEIAT
ncbi:MAG: SIMPL domain-containing protein [Acidobacteriota bacterium]